MHPLGHWFLEKIFLKKLFAVPPSPQTLRLRPYPLPRPPAPRATDALATAMPRAMTPSTQRVTGTTRTTGTMWPPAPCGHRHQVNPAGQE